MLPMAKALSPDTTYEENRREKLCGRLEVELGYSAVGGERNQKFSSSNDPSDNIDTWSRPIYIDIALVGKDIALIFVPGFSALPARPNILLSSSSYTSQRSQTRFVMMRSVDGSGW